MTIQKQSWLIPAIAASLLLACTEFRSNYWIGRGDASRSSGRHADALAAYARATEADPSSSKAWLRLGNECLETGDSPKAAAALEQAVRYDPNLYEAWYNLAVARLHSMSPDTAATALDRAIALKPEEGDAWFLMCTAKGSQGDWVTALTKCDKAVRLSPANKEARAMLAFLYLYLTQERKIAQDPAIAGLIDEDARAVAQRALAAKSISDSVAILNAPQ